MITGVILTLALVLTAIAGTTLTSATPETQKNTNQITNMTKSVALTEITMGNDAQGMLAIQNNTGETITINKITLNDSEEHRFNEQIISGDKKNLLLSNTVQCGQNSTTTNIKITYETPYGLTKTLEYENTKTECVPTITPKQNYSAEKTCRNNKCEKPSENYYNCPQDCNYEINNSMAKYVLCVYNTNLPESKEICDYYLKKRGLGQEHELDVNVYYTHYDVRDHYTAQYEVIDYDLFIREVDQPIIDYADSHPELDIRYLALAKGIPFKTYSEKNGNWTSTQALLWYETPASTFEEIGKLSEDARTSPVWDCVRNYLHFDPKNCTADPITGTKFRFAASFLTGFTVEDVKAMIDRATGPQPDLNKAKWLNYTYASGGTEGYAPTALSPYLLNAFAKYDFDLNNLVYAGCPLDAECSTNPQVFEFTEPIVAFAGNGANAPQNGLSRFWATKPWNILPFTNRSFLVSYESYFGATNDYNEWVRDSPQGVFANTIMPSALGGTNYSNAVSGGFATCAEPGGGAPTATYLWGPYYAGKTLSEVLMNMYWYWSKNTYSIGDPIMTIRDNEIAQPEEVTCVLPQIRVLEPDYKYSCKFKNGTTCSASDECASNLCSHDITGQLKCNSDSNSCIYDESGISVTNGSYICTNANTRYKCTDNEWTKQETCQNGCLAGECLENTPISATITVPAGSNMLFVLTTDAPNKKVHDLFQNPLPGLQILTRANDEWIIHDFDSIDLIWNSPNEKIEIGKGFLISAPEQFTLELEGPLLDTPKPIHLNQKNNLIGIPFCNNYTASKVLEEISQAYPNCNTIFTFLSTPTYWLANEISPQRKTELQLNDSYRLDFPINNKTIFYVSCEEKADFNWTPSCTN